MSEEDEAFAHNRRLFLELSALGAAGVALNGCAQAVGASPVATAGGSMAGMAGMGGASQGRPGPAKRM